MIRTSDGLPEPAGGSGSGGGEDGGLQPGRRHRDTAVAALLRRGPIEQRGAALSLCSRGEAEAELFANLPVQTSGFADLPRLRSASPIYHPKHLHFDYPATETTLPLAPPVRSFFSGHLLPICPRPAVTSPAPLRRLLHGSEHGRGERGALPSLRQLLRGGERGRGGCAPPAPLRQLLRGNEHGSGERGERGRDGGAAPAPLRRQLRGGERALGSAGEDERSERKWLFST